MADTFEVMKDGKLEKPDIFDVEITGVISSLYVYKEMLGEDRQDEKALIEGFRNNLTRIRHCVSEWLKED